MAEIVVDVPNQTIKAVMQPPEFAIVNAVIQESGTGGLVALFAAFIQQHGAEQREQSKDRIKRFAETASDEKIAAVIAVINHA